MDLADQVPPSTKSGNNITARMKVLQPPVKGIEAATVDLRPLDDVDMEVESVEDREAEQSKHTAAMRMSTLRSLCH